MWSYHHLGLCLRAFLRASPVTLQQTGSFASFTPLRIKGNLQFQLQFHTDIQHISDQKSQKYGFSAKRRCNHTLQLSGLISSWVQVWLLYTGQFRGQRTGTEIHSALFDSFIVIWTSRQHTVQHCSPSTDVFLTGRTLSLQLLLVCNATCNVQLKATTSHPLGIVCGTQNALGFSTVTSRSRPCLFTMMGTAANQRILSPWALSHTHTATAT